MSPFLLRLILAAILLLACLPAFAQQAPCAPRQHVLDQLLKNAGEVPIGGGINASGYLVEILSAPGGSWSLIVTRPDGISCLVGSGENWTAYEPRVPEKGA